MWFIECLDTFIVKPSSTIEEDTRTRSLTAQVLMVTGLWIPQHGCPEVELEGIDAGDP